MRLPPHITRQFLILPRQIYCFDGGWEPVKRWRWLRFAYRAKYAGFTYWSEVAA